MIMKVRPLEQTLQRITTTEGFPTEGRWHLAATHSCGGGGGDAGSDTPSRLRPLLPLLPGRMFGRSGFCCNVKPGVDADGAADSVSVHNIDVFL